MSLIYEPKGKAREYSPLAFNVYSGGCDHGCKYCYCAAINRGAWGNVPRVRDLRSLPNEASGASRQILLSFMSDPYCYAEVQHRQTRASLDVLRAARCSVAILTKGGRRCLRDLDLFCGWADGRVKVGATLTMATDDASRQWEPGAALPSERIEALRELHESGVKTWVSIEPVIDPEQSLEMIGRSLPYVDAYKVGRWNHDARANAIDWAAFGRAAVDMIRASGRALYVKVDLRPYFGNGYLCKEECDSDTLTLPDRPTESGLFG